MFSETYPQLSSTITSLQLQQFLLELQIGCRILKNTEEYRTNVFSKVSVEKGSRFIKMRYPLVLQPNNAGATNILLHTVGPSLSCLMSHNFVFFFMLLVCSEGKYHGCRLSYNN